MHAQRVDPMVPFRRVVTAERRDAVPAEAQLPELEAAEGQVLGPEAAEGLQNVGQGPAEPGRQLGLFSG